jgi:hypothetical protein
MCANQFSKLSRAPSNLYDTITAILQENRECITENVYPAPAECTMYMHGSKHQRKRIWLKKSFKELQLRNVLHYRTSLREEKTLAVLIPPKKQD